MSPRFVTVLRCLRAGKVIASGQLEELLPPPKEWEWIAQFSAETDFTAPLFDSATPLSNHRYRWITPKVDLSQPEFKDALHQGARIESVIPHRPSLEDVFLRYLEETPTSDTEAA